MHSSFSQYETKHMYTVVLGVMPFGGYTNTHRSCCKKSFLAAIVRNTLWFMDAGPIIAVVDGARVVVVVTANVFKRFNP